jgi:hypothetical protein
MDNLDISNINQRHLNSFLNATFIDSGEKIQILDDYLQKINDADAELLVLKNCKEYLEKVIKNIHSQNSAGAILENLIVNHISYHNLHDFDAGKYIVSKKDLNLEGLDLSKLFTQEIDPIKNLYVCLGVDFNRKDKELLNKIIEVRVKRWTAKSISNFYFEPLKWINTIIEKDTTPKEDKIEVKIIASQFVLLMKKLHENGIIKLPTNTNKTLNKSAAARMLYKHFNIYSDKGDIVEPQNLDDLFSEDRNKANKNFKKTVQDCTENISKTIKYHLKS